ncbi:MAG: C40 family peptidase [Burkholderiales bacterium]
MNVPSDWPSVGATIDEDTIVTMSAWRAGPLPLAGTLARAADGAKTALWRAATLVLLASAMGCSSLPPTSETAVRARVDDEAAGRAAANAREMVGRPYRYGGDTPAGFDCSGLVRYSYARAGIRLPRATAAQRAAGARISVRGIRSGDLLFFDQEGKKFSHVGLYLGEGRFVHAPSTGGRVRIDSLRDDYWRRHFMEARRL